jgi:hypothetical protein
MEDAMFFKKIRDDLDKYGLEWQEIQILQWNVDGLGGALALCDGRLQVLEKFSGDEEGTLELLLHGDGGVRTHVGDCEDCRKVEALNANLLEARANWPKQKGKKQRRKKAA